MLQTRRYEHVIDDLLMSLFVAGHHLAHPHALILMFASHPLECQWYQHHQHYYIHLYPSASMATEASILQFHP